MEVRPDLDQPPAFGFRAFCVICLASLALALQAAGVWFFAGDLRTPLWGPEELAPLAFTMPVVTAIYSFPLAAVAVGLAFRSGAATWEKRIGLTSLTVAVALGLASLVAPAIILGHG